MKEAYYFSHDSNARHDPKIIPMRGVYGSAGYGWYWILIEMMREANGYKLDIQGKYIWNAYAQQMGCNSPEEACSFINDCINEFNLFSSDEHSFWSESLIRRMGKREEVIEKRKLAANARWNKTQEKEASNQPVGANGMHMHDSDDANGMQGKERKVNESKRKERKVKKEEVPTRETKRYPEDSIPYQIALYLHSKIMVHAADSSVSHLIERSNLQKWADDCRKLLEIDKAKENVIRDVIDWATSDEFWKKNILSASKLREKFQDLAIKMTLERKQPMRSAGSFKSVNSRPKMSVVKDDGQAPQVTPEELEKMLELARELKGTGQGARDGIPTH
ncbi:DUF4373 domain-containing protein [Cohnella abietis]|uniref:Lin1244/Lin1753-like N-terminal domain-containing protein n=1 Tax=Cohnella abietis TaxID=2507935 RepID=A0A3T1D2X4_9BACL|nr:DUF4373 domain-containing protein [Cohnella abietis]BBI32456.1 hypothetical protein KCTCHS21_18550 [Cohnella abietis]